MRTLDLKLQSSADVERIASWALPIDAFEKLSQASDHERHITAIAIRDGILDDHAVTRDLIATKTTEHIFEVKAGFLVTILWNCTPENEIYGLELARAYRAHLASFAGVICSTLNRSLCLDIAYEFSAPTLPASLREAYPGAEYKENPMHLAYNAEDPAELQEEINWYKRWHPRRSYCQKIYDILSG